MQRHGGEILTGVMKEVSWRLAARTRVIPGRDAVAIAVRTRFVFPQKEGRTRPRDVSGLFVTQLRQPAMPRLSGYFE